jgi:hypothetical protein
MPLVHCNQNDCKKINDGVCAADEIYFKLGECDEYEEDEFVTYPEIYYIHTNNGWKQRKGNKINILDREMFETFGFVSDGRTGCGLFNLKKYNSLDKWLEEIKMTEAEFLEKLKELEKKNGISPLYEEDKNEK